MADIEAVYRLYFHDVFLYVCKLSGDRDIADDITAETFFRAMNAIDSFRGDCDIRVWLCRMAKNIYFSSLNAKKRQLPLEEELLPDEAPAADERLADASEAQTLRRLVHELAEPYKEVFMLRVFSELDFRSIGELFGRSDNWACVIYHRAKKRITQRMKELSKEDGTDDD